LAAFQASTDGRFWVSPEEIVRSKKNGVAVVAVTIAWYEFHTVSDQSAAC
jgi:hypothetical protein